MTEWKTRIGYLPPGLADDAKHVVVGEVPDGDAQYHVMRLIEQAFAAGYEAGFIRSMTEASWRLHIAESRAKEAANAAAREVQS